MVDLLYVQEIIMLTIIVIIIIMVKKMEIEM